MDRKIPADHMAYVRRREAEERAAAKRASSLAARRAHQELALLYAELCQPLGFSSGSGSV
jgi:hypothetical protein